MKYEFTEENELKIFYRGRSDAATVANMTNHSYFNLKGEGSGDVLDQEVCIHAKYFTPVKDSQSIPTGEYAPERRWILMLRNQSAEILRLILSS